MKKIFDSFKALSIGLKILIVFTAVVTVSGICLATYIIMNNEDTVLTVSQVQNENPKIPEDIIEQIPEEVIIVAEEPIAEEKEEKKEAKIVKYKDKEIKIPKSKVAAVNEAEDSQSQKTGGEQMSAADAVDKFENDGQSVGIDISKHQGKIDWAAVKKSGIEFAMIRCGFRGQTAGDIYEDAYFKTNVNGAVNNGIKVGIYFYSCAINETEALEEAAWVVNAIQSYRITYPVVYDFEDFGRYRCSGITGEQATSNAIAFLDYIKNAGYTPMMYASKNDITSKFNKSRLSGYKFWLAHYTATTNYTGSYQMWQYTSNGTVNGITGRVDMNIAYFRYGAVAEPKHTHDFENGTVIKTNDSKPATCDVAGVKYIRCASCSESKKVVLEALGHEYGKWEIEKIATEEEEGLKVRICSVCEKKETEEIPKINDEQNANNVTNTTNTTNTIGNTTKNEIGNEIINGVGHTHVYDKKETPSTCKVAGKKWEECSCGEKINEQALLLAEHSYGEEQQKDDGTYYKKCSVCEKEEVIIKENSGVLSP